MCRGVGAKGFLEPGPCSTCLRNPETQTTDNYFGIPFFLFLSEQRSCLYLELLYFWAI